MTHDVDPVPAAEPGANGPEQTSTPNRWMQLHARLHRNPVTGLLTKIVVTIVGFLVIIAGFIMMITPGPGLVAVILGLAILSTEWAWAGRMVAWLRRKAAAAAHAARTMDPAVRRRHILVVTGTTLLVVGLVVGYLLWQGWPQWAVQGWDKVQDISDKVPELPGM